MKLRHWLTIGGIISIAALVGAYFFVTKPVEKEVQTKPTGEAATNRFLAAERFYRKMGLSAATVRSLDEPPVLPKPNNVPDADATDVADAVILSEFAYDRGANHREAWQRWTRDGGHLIVPVPSLVDVEAVRPWLAGWGIDPDALENGEDSPDASAKTSASGSAPDVGPNADAGATRDEKTKQSSSGVSLSNVEPDATYETPLDIDVFLSSQALSQLAPHADWVAATENNEPLAVHWSVPGSDSDDLYEFSKDGVTFVMGTDFLENTELGNADHAELAFDLVARSSVREPKHILIARHGPRKVWLTYAASALWPALVTIAFLLLAAARQGGLRFGPPIVEERSGRRSRLEHLLATGRFLWRESDVSALVTPIRRALIRTFISGRTSRDGDVDDEELAERIAQMLDVDPSRVTRWLQTPPDNRKDFIELIRILEQSRRQA